MFRFFRQYLTLFSTHQMALSLFRFIGAAGRTQVVATTLGTFTMLLVFVLGGFIVAKGKLPDSCKLLRESTSLQIKQIANLNKSQCFKISD